jgi:hypothetical protein
VGLGLLCAAREALSLDVLTELAAWRYEDRQRFVRDARLLTAESFRRDLTATRLRALA